MDRIHKVTIAFLVLWVLLICQSHSECKVGEALCFVILDKLFPYSELQVLIDQIMGK